MTTNPYRSPIPDELWDWRRRESSMQTLRAGGSVWGRGSGGYRGSGSWSGSGARGRGDDDGSTIRGPRSSDRSRQTRHDPSSSPRPRFGSGSSSGGATGGGGGGACTGAPGVTPETTGVAQAMVPAVRGAAVCAEFDPIVMSAVSTRF